MAVSHSVRPHLRQRISIFIASPAGRTLLVTGKSNKQSFDELFQYLSKGNLTERRVGGAYLEYHGSYLEEECFAIRLIEIVESGATLSVTDFINETRSGLIAFHTARGGAVLFGDPLRFNIVTYAEKDDNRIGLSLFTASILEFDRGLVLQSAHGHVIGLTRTGHCFQRGSRLVRIADSLSSEEKAIAEKKTGVFLWNELGEHQQQFEKLKNHML
jgi:hypothetical protein